MTAHASTPRDRTVAVRFTEVGIDKIDEHKGEWSRSEYIRQAVAYAIKNKKTGPAKVEEPTW